MYVLVVLSVLGGYVASTAVMSDQVNVNLPATIPLEDYLCNTTVVLGEGEYHISSGPPCDISNEGNITITGSSMNTVRYEGKGRVFRFSIVQQLTMAVYIWNHLKTPSSRTVHFKVVRYGHNQAITYTSQTASVFNTTTYATSTNTISNILLY